MKTYKCTNCEHTFESEEMPFECPKCHSAAITKLGGDKNPGSAFKKYWWIIVAAIVAAIILFVAMPNGATRVKVKANSETGRMEVTVKGKHASEYKVVLRQNGIPEHEDSTTFSNTVIFNDLLGDYKLEVTYMGSGNVPKIRKFKTDYSFDRISVAVNNVEDNPVDTNIIEGVDVKPGTTIPKTDNPEIIRVNVSPKRVKKGDTYTITVQLSPHGCSVDNARFSLDGIKWQESNVFAGLAPGTYKVFAQNKDKEDLVRHTEITLQEGYSDSCPSVDEINVLLPKIANDDYNARRRLLDLLGRETKVNGAGGVFPTVSQWINQCIAVDDDVKHQVVAIDCAGGKVNSITIR